MKAVLLAESAFPASEIQFSFVAALPNHLFFVCCFLLLAADKTNGKGTVRF